MHWYHFVFCFFSGVFLANAVPHFVKGICGDPFPTPFAKPPGKGLSSPTVNVLWGLFNLAIGWILLHHGYLHHSGAPAAVTFFAGIAGISIPMSIRFAQKHSH